MAWHERDALPKGQSPQLLPCNWLAATAPQCNWLPACRSKSRAPIAAVPERARERPRHGRLREVGIRCGLTPTCAGAGRERPRRPRQQQFGTTATARRWPSRPTDIPCFKSLGSPRASCRTGSRGECNASTDYGPRLEPAALLPAGSLPLPGTAVEHTQAARTGRLITGNAI